MRDTAWWGLRQEACPNDPAVMRHSTHRFQPCAEVQEVLFSLPSTSPTKGMHGSSVCFEGNRGIVIFNKIIA
jgi:hypothetical protein